MFQFYFWTTYIIFSYVELMKSNICACVRAYACIHTAASTFPGITIAEQGDWDKCIQGSTAVVNLAGMPISTRWSPEVIVIPTYTITLHIIKSKIHVTKYIMIKPWQNYRFKMLYHKTTYLEINLTRNYRFKVKYHKTINFILKVSQKYRFYIEVITKLI